MSVISNRFYAVCTETAAGGTWNVNVLLWFSLLQFGGHGKDHLLHMCLLVLSKS